jgi:aquaporin Z
MFDFIVEFIGTFIFLSVILTTGQAIPIGLALAAAIYFGGKISGGHFNPAVSTMMVVKGSISVERYIGYIVAQVLGGLVALMFFNATASKAVKK